MIALEDAHWIDPTSLDVFGRLVDRLPNLRALLVVTCRPEFAAPWVGGAHVASLPLSRFGRRDSLAMVDRVTGGKALPAEVLEQIVAKTDGVPLFVEELTQAVLESGLLREEDGAYVLASALIPLAIPSTLQDSLMARLDRLAPVKEIAQIAAAIGREFSYRLLEAAAPIQGPALQSALGQLMAAELIHGRGSPRRRLTSSNMRWCRTRPMPHCCIAVASASMPTSRGRCRSCSPTRSRPRRRSSRIITPRRASTNRRRGIG